MGAKPYGKLAIAAAYAKYYFRAKNKHSIHPPTVYKIADEVLNAAHKVRYPNIESERSRLKKSKQVISFTDYGKSGNIFDKKIADIARVSLKPKKYAQLISKLVAHQAAKHVLELGTSLGITTAYLASNEDTDIHTMEGDSAVADIAQQVWNQLGLQNIKCTIGNFDTTLDQLQGKTFDVIYIDGNHKLEPTLRYFEILKQHATDKTLFIFDDIHYSKDMESAWDSIKAHNRTTSTIDLFFIGLVYIDPSLSKQHFELRY
ncbi:MAG: putative O-methyltransferase YrrM [Bacteroidia bacterium]|jgi:predicted O-methyltransferase YrrM